MNSSASANVLSVNGLVKSYGRHEVLRGLDLSVTRGAIHGLVGLNGSGKTTTLECLLGLQKFDAGTVHALEFQPHELHLAKGRIVAIFDTPSLNPNLTVQQCLQQAALLCPDIHRSSSEVQRLLDIEQYSKFRIKQLSLGNKRRVSIAQALLGQPELILLDEPFNGLDAAGVDDVLALIKQLNSETGTSFLLSSHQLPYLEQVCTHLAILHQGEIRVSAAVNELLQSSGTHIRLKAGDSSQLETALSRMAEVRIEKKDESGYWQVELTSGDSATLNKALLEQGVALSELMVENPSLEKLFREQTQAAES